MSREIILEDDIVQTKEGENVDLNLLCPVKRVYKDEMKGMPVKEFVDKKFGEHFVYFNAGSQFLVYEGR